MKKKYKKNKNLNQKSFYFEDFLETNKKTKVFKKSFTPSWESFIIPLSIIIIAFLHNSKK